MTEDEAPVTIEVVYNDRRGTGGLNTWKAWGAGANLAVADGMVTVSVNHPDRNTLFTVPSDLLVSVKITEHSAVSAPS